MKGTRFELSSDFNLRELRAWCAENCDGHYKISNPASGFKTPLGRGAARFDQETDAMAFKLRWL